MIMDLIKKLETELWEMQGRSHSEESLEVVCGDRTFVALKNEITPMLTHRAPGFITHLLLGGHKIHQITYNSFEGWLIGSKEDCERLIRIYTATQPMGR